MNILYESSNDALSIVKGEYTSLMLFGSYARNNHSTKSDIDILQLVKKGVPSYQRGKYVFSVYDVETLRNMAKEGSLFVLHLITDGKLLADNNDVLNSILKDYRAPESYDATIKDLKVLANLLDIQYKEYVQRWKRFNNIGLYILRTILFIEFAAKLQPTFSIGKIAALKEDDRIEELNKLKQDEKADFSKFRRLVELIQAELNCQIKNEFGSVEAYIVNNYETSDLVASVGLKILDDNPSEDLAYCNKLLFRKK